jgi:periplasmic copper chaperone A
MKSYLLALVSITFLLASCIPTPASQPSQSAIEVSAAQVRLPGGQMPGMNSDNSLAGYMVIKNTGSVNDELVGAQVEFANMSMLHETVIDSNNVASMKMVESIPVPAGQTVELKTGGFHIMFTGVKGDLKVGDTVKISLQFKSAGKIFVNAKVTDQ